MSVALIRLTKKIILDKPPENKFLNEFWDYTVGMLKSVFNLQGLTHFDSSRHQANNIRWFFEDIKEYTNSLPRILRGKIPTEDRESLENYLPIKSADLMLIEANIEKSFFKFALYLISDDLTFLQTNNGLTVYAIGDQSDSLILGNMIETNIISLTKELYISHYRFLPSPKI